MINTDKNVNNAAQENSVTSEEKLHKIIDRTGVTPQQAQEALEKNNGDLLDAMIYVERTYGQASKTAQQAQSAQNAQNTGAQPQPEFKEAPKTSTAQPSADFSAAVKKIGDFLIGNRLVINRNGQEVTAIPMLICAIALLLRFDVVLLLMLGSQFFNVSYRFRGPNLGNAKINLVFDTVYNVIQNIKTSLS